MPSGKKEFESNGKNSFALFGFLYELIFITFRWKFEKNLQNLIW